MTYITEICQIILYITQFIVSLYLAYTIGLSSIYNKRTAKNHKNHYTQIICKILQEHGYKTTIPEYEQNTIIMSKHTIISTIIDSITGENDHNRNSILIKINHNETIKCQITDPNESQPEQTYNLSDPQVFNHIINYYETTFRNTKNKPKN